MNFKLRTLTLENFVVFIDRTTIDFSTTSINMIEAVYKNDSTQSNGAGKSLIIDAISLALFGKGIRSQYLTDYIPDKYSKNGIYVGLELEDDKGNILKIERWRRAGSETNKAKLWYKSACISKDLTIPKIDEAIQEFIGVTHSNFLSCIFSIMIPGFLKLKPAQRFETLENALAVKKMENILKKINGALRLIEEKLNGTNDLLIEKQQLLGQEIAKKEIYSGNIESLKLSIENQQKELQGFSEQEKIVGENRISAYKLLEQGEEKALKLQQSKLLLESELSSLSANRKKLEAKSKTFTSALKQNSSGHLECLICKSIVTSKSKEHIKHHYDDELVLVEKEIKQKETNLTKLSDQFSKQEILNNKAKEFIRQADSDLRILQASMIACEKTIISSRKSISLAKSSFNTALLSDLKKETMELQLQKDKLKKDAKMTIAWKQALSKNGLRLAYIKEEVSTLSAIATKYASATYNKPIQINFFINEEKDNPTLDFTVNGKNSNTFSTGESRLLEIAMTLSLMTLLKTAGLTLNFLVLDEALDGLSDASKQNIIKLIDELSGTQQILLISHDTYIRHRPGNIIKVTKDPTINESTISQSIR